MTVAVYVTGDGGFSFFHLSPNLPNFSPSPFSTTGAELAAFSRALITGSSNMETHLWLLPHGMGKPLGTAGAREMDTAEGRGPMEARAD